MRLTPSFEQYPSQSIPVAPDSPPPQTCCEPSSTEIKPKYVMGMSVPSVPTPRIGLRAALILTDYVLDHTKPGVNDTTLAYLARKYGFIPYRCEPDRDGIYVLRKLYNDMFTDHYLKAQSWLLKQLLDTFAYHQKSVPPIFAKCTEATRTLSMGSIRALSDLHVQLSARPDRKNWNLIDAAVAGAHLTLRLDLKGQTWDTNPANLTKRGVTLTPTTMLNPDCLETIYTAARYETSSLLAGDPLRRAAQLTRIAIEVMQVQAYVDEPGESNYSVNKVVESFDKYYWEEYPGLIPACQRLSMLSPETALVVDDLSCPVIAFDKTPTTLEVYNPTMRMLLARYIVETCYRSYCSNPDC